MNLPVITQQLVAELGTLFCLGLMSAELPNPRCRSQGLRGFFFSGVYEEGVRSEPQNRSVVRNGQDIQSLVCSIFLI